MSDQPTYEELVLRCQRLANIIVRNNRGTEELLRAEVKKAKAEAWDEGYNNGWGDGRTDSTVEDYNPYKEKK
ncbi:hypothetical protein [Glutamicibacter sp. MCAF14]|uniref:hypothetical protein n=1 Tax=Glutamicibacter sp. MCAF14 TaxID=3233043 RepID=UPI003F90BDE0